VAVGPGVEDFKTGDKVVAVLSGSVSAHSLFWCFFFFFYFLVFVVFQMIYVGEALPLVYPFRFNAWLCTHAIGVNLPLT